MGRKHDNAFITAGYVHDHQVEMNFPGDSIWNLERHGRITKLKFKEDFEFNQEESISLVSEDASNLYFLNIGPILGKWKIYLLNVKNNVSIDIFHEDFGLIMPEFNFGKVMIVDQTNRNMEAQTNLKDIFFERDSEVLNDDYLRRNLLLNGAPKIQMFMGERGKTYHDGTSWNVKSFNNIFLKVQNPSTLQSDDMIYFRHSVNRKKNTVPSNSGARGRIVKMSLINGDSHDHQDKWFAALPPRKASVFANTSNLGADFDRFGMVAPSKDIFGIFTSVMRESPSRFWFSGNTQAKGKKPTFLIDEGKEFQNYVVVDCVIIRKGIIIAESNKFLIRAKKRFGPGYEFNFKEIV